MGATLAALLRELEPDGRLLMLERLGEPALESSAAVNNAGTGHAANCELNYTPERPGGGLDISKALRINAAFEQSLQFWSALRERGRLTDSTFIRPVPHLSLVFGEEGRTFLRRRHQLMVEHPAFAAMDYSEDAGELAGWMPLVMEGRREQDCLAATRVERGTDVDFGRLTRQLLAGLTAPHGPLELACGVEVTGLQRRGGLWQVAWRSRAEEPGPEQGVVETPFVFLGAGGGTLPLLQRAGVAEARVYGGFPVSGEWLVCHNTDLVERHRAKVYGRAEVGAPPMSMPHLDTRWIDGRRSLLFGPFAGFSTRFLRQGSLLDWPRSLRLTNLLPTVQAGLGNLSLVRYLIGQLSQSQEQRLEALRRFMPGARADDWRHAVGGQRVQIIRQEGGRGVLRLGTEVVATADGSLAALLGASPGASTAVSIMLEVLKRCWADRMVSSRWREVLLGLVPSHGQDLNTDAVLLDRVRRHSDATLGLSREPVPPGAAS
ncbi:malate dehydrogenase (quinone) [Synechococcus sp. RSCCF101]|uniref:malate dehydrogenase (quinone) n=1 Tax=Synechococcus sp. RSCCF101 TaxID=2511069 RepID=UPI00351A4572